MKEESYLIGQTINMRGPYSTIPKNYKVVEPFIGNPKDNFEKLKEFHPKGEVVRIRRIYTERETDFYMVKEDFDGEIFDNMDKLELLNN
jgi:hypothetical protein